MKQNLLILTVIGAVAITVAVVYWLHSSKNTEPPQAVQPRGNAELHTLLVDDYHSANSRTATKSAIAHELIVEQLRTNEAFLVWATNSVIMTITQFVQNGSIPIYGSSGLTRDALKFRKVTA